ncbi:MAG: twin-arginine translocation signal domain-containing protein [Puniceicoccaceae bacterium]
MSLKTNHLRRNFLKKLLVTGGAVTLGGGLARAKSSTAPVSESIPNPSESWSHLKTPSHTVTYRGPLS